MFEGLLQPMHLILILGIMLIFFGPKKLPQLGRGLGEGIRDFKDAMNSTHSKQSVEQNEAVPLEN